MAELVAGAFLSSFLQVAFERLASHDFLNHFRHRKLDADLLKQLKVVLLSVDKIVEDAEERQYRDFRVKQWLDELKDEVYKAQDLLDDIAIEASRQKLKDELRTAVMGKVRGCFAALVNGNKFDKEMSRIQKLISNLDSLVKQNETLGLREVPSASIQLGVNRNVCERVPTTLLIDESNIYGRDVDKEIIVGKLLSQNMEGNQLHADVIAIQGMGGMGKTTLARLIYDDARIKDRFQHRAWVCVSEEFDVDRVTTAILHTLDCPNIDQLCDFHSRQLKLQEILTGENLFLVLDDIWNENRAIWEAFQAPLKRVTQQSKILITTRNRTVVEAMHCAVTHSLKPLEDGDCWNLFAKHAFKNQCDAADEDLEKIGREIINNCGGLPLAIKTLGSLLYGKLSIRDWEKVLKSDIWQLSDNESNIIPSLRLSYHYLPSHMKRCFAYCSIFAKDYDIDKDVLIQLWMADGLICPTQKSMSLEEAGNEIFNDLRAKAFFEPSRNDGDYFVMHDLLNDLAKSVAGEFFVQLEIGQAQCEDMPSKIRYFSYTSDRDEHLENLDKVFQCHQLRSFLLLTNKEFYLGIYRGIMSGFSHLKYIRELSLIGYREIQIVIDDIGNLKHLHYLDLSWTSIVKLLNSICLLINLQTLKLRSCQKLTKLPSNLCKLINLRHLDLLDCGIKKMPKHMGKLSQLQTMNKFVVTRKGGSNINELGALKHLTGSLTINHMECIIDARNVRDANLKEKQLDSLRLFYALPCDGCEEAQEQEQVLEALEPNHLSRFFVKGYRGTKFPNWDVLPSLHHLELFHCYAMEWLPRGGMLSNLQSLSITKCPKLIASGRDLGLHELLSLKELYIHKCYDMESFPGEGLWPPNLQSLSFKDCYNLRRINHRGLVHLHSLTSLSFEYCPCMSFEGMPEHGLPSSLSHLKIGPWCLLLKERCEKEKGSDWPKISHILHVDVVV